MRLPLEISPDALRQKLEAGERLRLIDIREHDERDEIEIAGTRSAAFENIPMLRLPHAVERLREPRGHQIVLFCWNGTRSLRAVAWLRRNGVPRAQSLTGGLEAWRRSMSAELPAAD